MNRSIRIKIYSDSFNKKYLYVKNDDFESKGTKTSMDSKLINYSKIHEISNQFNEIENIELKDGLCANEYYGNIEKTELIIKL